MKNNVLKKFLKASAAALLAAGIGALATGCKGYKIQIVPDDSDDKTQTDGNKEDLNNQGNQNQGNQNEQGGQTQGNQNQQGGSTTPTQPTTPAEPDYSQYSQLLQDVLTSDYYNDLIAKYKTGNLHSKGHADTNNLIDAIPYNFLENQGEDIELIKYNEAGANCYYYTKKEEKNKLYGYAKLTYGNDEDRYNKIYTLKYDITDKELKDFEMLMEGNYYQTGLFIQELDNQKTAELISECCINTESYEKLLKQFNNEKFNIASNFATNKVQDFIITSITEPDDYAYSLDVELISDVNNSFPVSSREIANANLLLKKLNTGAIIKNGIFKLQSANIKGSLQEISNPTPITYYYYFDSDKTKDLINNK